ncbi:hypothetical protein [Spirosoma sp. 48-14]|uniref:hypothetical protein n=1 Tax=Spirosoma sp. 48-14 TaxID=1895854 RepID=UPI00095BD4B4|nr:hypothetical protein [Spirosoma sp. 48-14]OJW76314.1 MAG: hypothetical protein BGO59_22610 [Spirosoma sp. 48-14]
MESLPNHNSNPTIDLSSYLNAPTNTVDRPDFDAEPIDQTNPEDFRDDDPESDGMDDAEPEKSFKDYLEEAGLFINLFDSLQSGVLKPIYRSKYQEPDDADLIRRYKEETRQIKAGTLLEENRTVGTDPFLDAVQRVADCNDAVKTLPFTAREKTKLKEPLAKVLEKYSSVSISPEMALLLAVLMIMAPRIIQVLPESWGDKFSSIATLGLFKNAKTE